MINLTSLLWLILLPAATIFQGQPGFDKTLSSAIARSQSEQRQLMLYFTSASCTKCKQLDEYFAQEYVNEALDKKYVSAKVDITSFDGKACSQIYDITDVPAIVIVKPDGTITARKDGGLQTEDIESLILYGKLPTGQDDMLTSSGKIPTTSKSRHSEEVSKAYALQVGFFSSKENAENLKDEIESKGFEEARVNTESRDNKTYYRVLVGEYADADYARSDMKTLEKSGFSVKVHKYRP